MVYVIAPRDQVKGENQYPEFREVLPALQAAAIDEAQRHWDGFGFGGLRPDNNEFGIAPLQPQDVIGAGTFTFVQSFSDPGSWTDIFNYSVPEDQIHALAGLAIPDSDLIFAALRFEVGDRKLPKMNIEESRTFPGGFDMLFKQDKGEEFVIDEEESILVRGLQERGTGGHEQRVIPLGFELFRRKDPFITESSDVSSA